MEGFNTLQPLELESDKIRRKDKLESTGKIIEGLFGSIEEDAIKRIIEDPTYKGLGERQ